MADNGKPSRIIPIRDHQDPSGKRMSAAEIKQEIIAGVAAGSMAVGQKLYTQLAEETTRMLEEMEHRLRQDFDAKIEQLMVEANTVSGIARPAMSDSEREIAMRASFPQLYEEPPTSSEGAV